MFVVVDSGIKVWKNSANKPHREDGPAIEYPDGGKEWWVDGKLHRVGGPAIEWDDGLERWYFNGNYILDTLARRE